MNELVCLVVRCEVWEEEGKATKDERVVDEKKLPKINNAAQLFSKLSCFVTVGVPFFFFVGIHRPAPRLFPLEKH